MTEAEKIETDASVDFKKGKALLAEGNLHAACRAFHKAYKKEPNDPQHISYYGMSAALSRGEIKPGLERCTKAIKMEFFRPEYYENLARVYIAAGNKKGAIMAVMKGIKYEQKTERLHNMLVELGVREKPVLGFLKRSNFINRILGIFFRRTIPQMMTKKGPGKQSR